MKKTILLAPLLTALLLAAPAVNASTVAAGFSGGSLLPLPDDDSWTIGFDFRPKSAIVVDGLSFYDYGSDDLNSSHPLGLWNGTLNTRIREAVITTANSVLAGPTINDAGQFRFVEIAPILLKF